jgi:hypothetical protein
LKAEGVIVTEDPWEWRRIGEVNSARVYADVPEPRFRELFAQAERMAYFEMPKTTYPAWGCISPPQSVSDESESVLEARSHSTFGSTVLKLLRSVRI